MSNEIKTHYRKVFKSDHLGVADLEDFLEMKSNLIFTIDYVRQEIGATVAGKEINANIAYFKEGIKPLVLNATNSKVMKSLTNSCFIENWENVVIQLYIDPTAKLRGETVGGVRVSPKRVTTSKPVLTKDNIKMWDNAKKAFARDGNFNSVLSRVNISIENQNLMISELNNV